MIGICKCCNQQQDLRLGICMACADCESIIEEGLDMFDQEPVKIEGYSTSMAKLRYVLERFDIVNRPNKINPQPQPQSTNIKPKEDDTGRNKRNDKPRVERETANHNRHRKSCVYK